MSRSALAERTGEPADPPPARIVHLGLGAFHRAHQAWFTSVVDEERTWGIAAFTGRSATAADLLAPQDGLFTLIERSGTGDVAEIVRSIVEVWDGSRVDRLCTILAAPETALVTLTITEAGYRLGPDGHPDLDDPVVAHDAAILQRAGAAPIERLFADAPGSALARLVLGLEARRRADAGPIAVVPCDNVPGNGSVVRAAVLALASHVGAPLQAWVSDNVSFVSTSVDRITPKTTEEDRELAQRLTGWVDRAPVVTEPFSDWILAGDFPRGRPSWERVGATFVDDIEPFERRKLWMLNGAHTLLACAGILRGFTTVAEAIADPELRALVSELWDEATRHLPPDMDVASYRIALLARFDNERIEHRLDQIAVDSSLKVAVRIVPVARAERAAGRSGVAAARVLGAWIAFVRTNHADADSQSSAIAEALAAPDDAAALLALVDHDLAADSSFAELVLRFAEGEWYPALPQQPL
ncbi:MAG: mannitol dehydrogenase family protein [Salinibacterium sp.]|nr:mannitol dehydrogenase family protein [Salinibacterium sp.]